MSAALTRRGKPPAAIDPERLMRMVREGATNAELAAAFKCCTRTLERWRGRHPEVNAIIVETRRRLFAW